RRTAPNTNAAPVQSATDWSNHVGARALADRGSHRRRTPPTRRPPASPLASDGEPPVPDSGPCSRLAPGPKAASLLAPRRPAPECRPTCIRSCTPANRTASPARPTSARVEAASRSPPGTLAIGPCLGRRPGRRLVLDPRRDGVCVLPSDALL